MTDNPLPSGTNAWPARVMWLIALVLAVGAVSLAVAALPGRARPLFLLPFVFGLAASAISVALRRSLALKCSLGAWLLTTACALGGYGQVVAASYQQFQSANSSGPKADQQALVAIQMLKDTEHGELAEQMQADVDARRPTWEHFLSRRYSALGSPAPRIADLALVAEVALVIAGVAVGRRLLDAGQSACQS